MFMNISKIDQQYFGNCISFAKTYIESNKSIDEKKLILEYMIDVIKKDVQSFYMSSMYYCEKNKCAQINGLPIPIYYDSDELKFDISTGQMVMLDLSKDNYVVIPWNSERMIWNLVNIKNNEFEYDESNHKAFYYNYLDFGYVYNGNHSITSGHYFRKGEIKAELCDTPKIFDLVVTNGHDWYIGKEKIKAHDFRFCLIYELSKMKYKLENKL